MHNTNSYLTSRQIAKRYELSYQTINYYTTLGLLHAVKRQGNQRLYDEQDVRRQLQEISRLKDEGYPLRLIARMVSRDARGPDALQATRLPRRQ